MTTYGGVPGVVETKEAFGETTLVVDPARIVETCTHLRDEEGFVFLADISPADYLGWARRACRATSARARAAISTSR
jgi:NADH:ubiquinone oxidoreductase subunit C